MGFNVFLVGASSSQGNTRTQRGLFNNVAYQNDALSVQNRDISKGDQRVLFYSIASLDHSETSMLDSAGLERHRPVTN